MEEKKFEIGQRVRVVDYSELFNGKKGTIKRSCNHYGVEFDEHIYGHCGDWNGKDGHCWWLSGEYLEAIEDELIEKEVEHIIEEQDQQYERQMLEQYLEESKSTSLTANQYIALELIKAWAGQSGNPVKFSLVMEYYKTAVKELDEAQNQAQDGEKK